MFIHPYFLKAFYKTVSSSIIQFFFNFNLFLILFSHIFLRIHLTHL
ncbi:hypothetical protein HMPREF3293_00979 [Christensenella minuta]|uniref:Uncharacterized protein n=1 Tax=Christensenella minuta TaxID=626937 RepID=A0A136Q6I0_9FIRM|nr:hypothetical protein HMPREF3293_00979 [Christensenella minuta]